eukprot:352499-Chlamydomonas_euryale.AAC.4
MSVRRRGGAGPPRAWSGSCGVAWCRAARQHRGGRDTSAAAAAEVWGGGWDGRAPHLGTCTPPMCPCAPSMHACMPATTPHRAALRPARRAYPRAPDRDETYRSQRGARIDGSQYEAGLKT